MSFAQEAIWLYDLVHVDDNYQFTVQYWVEPPST